jgi:hypothetical protein
MVSAGLLSVRAALSEGKIGQVAVHLQRPSVTQLFLGQSPDAVLQKVPLLYTLCAQAQRSAAQAALDAAMGATPSSVPDTALWIESLHENLWRLLLDWPPALGLPAASQAFVAWRAVRNSGTIASQTDALLADVVQELSAQCLQLLAGTDEPVAPGAANLCPAPWLSLCLGETQSRPEPVASASPRGAYRARLAQLADAALALRTAQPYPVARVGREGWGVSQVLTARGVLTHAAQLEAGQVTSYRVWAPTDAYFSDARAIDTLLSQQRFVSTKEARRALDLAILALDPCVPYVVELRDA